MTWGGRGLPCQMGSLRRQSPLKLAEDCIALAAERSKTAKAKFAVTIDPNGSVFVDWPHAADVREHVATITRKSDPDWLCEEIEFVWEKHGARV